MANIVYRGSAVPNAVNSAAAKNAPLTNEEIDKNLYALDIGKLDKNDAATQTISGPVQFSSAVTINGNLTVSGSVTTINSTTLSVDDKNIELGDVATPTNATADGGGITLLGGNDGNKTFNWLNATSSWTSSENLNLATGKTYKIAGSDVLTATQVLGKTLPAGTVVGTSDAQTLTNKTITGTFTGPLTGNVTGNADTATKLQTARTINGQSFDGSANISFSTTAVSEGTNLYYTDARARAALSFTAGSGAYNSTSGVITIPTNTNQLTNGAGFATTAYVDTAVAGKDNTDEITEGLANLYFTNARARAALSFTAGSGAYNSTSGVITIPTNTNQLTNGAGYVTSSGVTDVTATAPIVSSRGTTPDISIPPATASANGYMTSAYAAKLDGIAAGAQVNVATNLAQGTRTGTTVPITSSTGTTATLDVATTSLAGVMSSADKTKLDGIATGATANTGTVTSVATGTGLTGGTITTTGTISIDSTVVTLTGAQTLTNKTLTLPTIGGTGATFNGSTSGTTVLKAAAAAGTTTITMPATTGTMALTSDLPTVNSGALTLNIGTAAATNNTVTVITGTGFNANSASAATYQLGIGPALTALASTMTGAGTGFIRKNGADTYSIDTNTYLTGNQSITLTGDVTGSGTTSIATTLATVNSNVGTFNNVTVNAKGLVTSASNVAYATSAHQTHYIGTTQVQASSANQAVTGITSITGETGFDGTGGYKRIDIIGGSPSANNTSWAQGATVMLQGGNSAAGGTGAFQYGGSVYIVGGYSASTSNVTKGGGSVYIEGGGTQSTGGGTRTNGSIYIGTSALSINNCVTADIILGRSTSHSLGSTTTYINGPIKVSGSIANETDTNSYLDLASTTTSLNVRGKLVSGKNIFGAGTTGGLILYGANASPAAGEYKFEITPTYSANLGGGFGTVYTTTFNTASGSNRTGYSFSVDGLSVFDIHGPFGLKYRNWERTGSFGQGPDFQIIAGGVVNGTSIPHIINLGYTGNSFSPALTIARESDNTALLQLSTAGNLTATGNVTAYSDARLKTNVQTIENSLDKTLKLRGVSYERDGKKNIGVIAQEIREILPEVVYENDDEQKTLSVSYGNVVGLLIEAIKELNAKVEDLQNQLANK
jgi:hypothetical protein